MKLEIDSRLTFISGVLALLLFIAAGAASITPLGIAGVSLLSLVLGALKRPSFSLYAGGILFALAIFTTLGLLFGASASAGIVMVPFIAAMVFVYASVAFFTGRLVAKVWH